MSQIELPKVLFVDDRPENLFFLETLVKDLECASFTTTSGQDALHLMTQHAFALVFLDIQMPEMNGFQVAEAMRANPNTRQIPIVFITAVNRDRDSIFKGYELGAVDYISKPVSPVILRNKTKVLLEFHRQKRLLEVQASTLEQKMQELEREIRKRRRAEEVSRQYTRRLAALHDIDQAILVAQSPETIAQAALDHLQQLIPCQRATVVEFDMRAQEAVVLAANTENSETPRKGKRFPLYWFGGKEELNAGIIHLADDLEHLSSLSETEQALLAEGMRSYINIPLIAQGALIGSLNLGASTARAFSLESITIAREVAASLALAIHSAQVQVKTQSLLNDLALSHRYKSQFMANMSHELRTPLNSLLVLSKLLGENKSGNLTEKQLQYAHTIHTAGSDLLALINEVLDLSSAAAEQITLNPETMSLKGLCTYIRQNFGHLAQAKHLELRITLSETLPEAIYTDRRRVEQIVKHLLANAVKFTAEGEIHVHLTRPGELEHHPSASRTMLLNEKLSLDQAVAIVVTDTGPGIPPDKQRLIFEAFQQVDGTISRKYRGIGLGLSIVWEFAKLLGASIFLRSEKGKGSSFIICLPEHWTADTFSDMQPSGWEVKETHDTALDEGELTTPSSAVQQESTSGVEAIRDDRHESIAPTDQFVLIIADAPDSTKSLFNVIREQGFKGLIAGDGAAGLQLAYQYRPVAIILQQTLAEIGGRNIRERLECASDTRHIPVYGLDPDSTSLAENVRTFLQNCETAASSSPHKDISDAASPFTGTRIMLVDDDMRTVFALSSILEEQGVELLIAENGEEAWEMLAPQAQIALMLLDVTQPDSQQEAILQKIRHHDELWQLPIIVLTATVIKGDRQKWIRAGANDYLSKPINTDKLLSLLKVWLYP